MTRKMKLKLKSIIEAFRSINGRRLCEATGITLAIAFFLATIIFLANLIIPGKISEKEIEEGLDVIEHHEDAYN